jgi:hypothetical protein
VRSTTNALLASYSLVQYVSIVAVVPTICMYHQNKKETEALISRWASPNTRTIDLVERVQRCGRPPEERERETAVNRDAWMTESQVIIIALCVVLCTLPATV